MKYIATKRMLTNGGMVEKGQEFEPNRDHIKNGLAVEVVEKKKSTKKAKKDK